MHQGSTAWHDWRSKGIGASEAPIVMGESPYQTILELYEIKKGIRPHQETNWAMQRGNDMEPKARASFELLHNIDMQPILAEHKDYPFIRASMDGFNKELNVGLEIKCCGKNNFALIQKGEVPLDYKAQIQQQLIVTGAEFIYLFAFDGEKGVSLKVFPDIVYCQILLAALISFWDLVERGIPPDPTERDYTVISDPALESYCEEWKSLNDSIKLVEEKIRNGLQVKRGVCNGLKFTKSSRKGSSNETFKITRINK